MARSISVIKAQILAAVQAESALAGLTSPSQTAIYTTWIFIQAVTINLLEQAQDIYKAFLEALLAKSAPATPLWIQDQTFKFQYSATVPQIVAIQTDFSIAYPVPDATLRIVTQCSVQTDVNKNILVKVAVGSPPAAMGATPLGQLQGYLTSIIPAGLYVTASSLDADKLYVKASVYYDGQYSNISEDVIAALDAYCASFQGTKFNGIIRVSEIEAAIFAVPGVLDVVIDTVKMRSDATVLASATVIYDLTTAVNIRLWNTIAGYAVQETTASNTFTDTLTFVPKSN